MNVKDYNELIKQTLLKSQKILSKNKFQEIFLSLTNNIIPYDSLVILGGRPRTGKTTLLLDFVAKNSIPTPKGNKFLEYDNKPKNGLLYFIGHKQELLLRKWVSIVTKSSISNNSDEQDLGLLYVDYLSQIKSANIDFNFYDKSEEVLEVLESDIKRTNADYVIIDSITGKYNFEIYDTKRYEFKNDLLPTAIELQKKTKKFFLISVVLGHDAWYRDGSKRHVIEDLHSMELESKADVILMIYRPEVYGLETDENGDSLKNTIELYAVIDRYDNIDDHYWQFEHGIPKIKIF